jgi:hypothetical protein
VATAVNTRARSSGYANGRTTTRSTSLAQGLGWFSIGLGLAQVAAPRGMARLIGVQDSDRNAALMRALGMRELASGMGILSQRNEGAWLWGRVLGDTMDLALLGAAMNDPRSDRTRNVAAAAAVLGVTLLDAMVAKHRSADHHRKDNETLGDDAPRRSWTENGRRHLRRSITINKRVEEVTRAWSNPAGRPGLTTQLDQEEVSISAGPRGSDTELRVEVSVERGSRVANLVRTLKHDDAAAQLERDLRHFKQVMETGEIVHSDASIHRGMHPARPASSLAEGQLP